MTNWTYYRLAEIYFGAMGATYNHMVVQRSPALMEKAIALLTDWMDGRRDYPITNKDLGIKLPKDALT